MTKADVLRGLDCVRVCVAYEVDGQRTQRADARRLADARPIYEDLPGFEDDLSSCRAMTSLPATVRRLVELVETHAGVPVKWLGVGPERQQSVRLRYSVVSDR
jgi:adenylosuccinate synthase